MSRKVALTDALEAFETGRRPKGGATTEGIPSLGGEHVTAGGVLKLDPMKFVPLDFYQSMSKGRLRVGDVLVVKDGATTGRVAIVEESFPFDRAAVNEHLFLLRADRLCLDPRFLYFYLRSAQGQKELMSDFRGAAQGGISREIGDKVRVPLLPLNEQRRIVDLLSRAEGILRLRREAQAKAAEIIPALFLDMFGDPATNPKGWATRRVDQLCSVQTGATPLRERRSYYEGGQVPWVKTGEVCGELIHSTEECITELAVQETKCKVFPVGTILVAMYGQGQTRGRAAMLARAAATNQACAAILPGGAINQDFLYALLQMQYERLRAMGRGGNQANLNLGMIKALEVPTPPPELQGAFVARAIALRSIRLQHDSATNAAEAAFHALLARVFAGDTEVASVVRAEAAVV